jgi:hypothetical protein
LAGAFQEIVADFPGCASATTFVGAPDPFAFAGEVAKVMLLATMARISARFNNEFARKILKFIFTFSNRRGGLDNPW